MRQQITGILSPKFPAPAAENLLAHYETVVGAFSGAHWDDVLSATGKFVESVVRCLRYLTTGNLLDRVDVGAELDGLERTPKTSADETVRLLIPRVLRPLYQIACNRGARHDRLNFNPNRMDAALAVQAVSWVMAELIRYCYPGVMEPSHAQELVDAIVEPKYPTVEQVDGLTFLHTKDVSARDAILVKLRMSLGRRVPREELFETARLHGHTVDNARATLSNLRRARLLHENAQGVRLLAPGLVEADKVLKNGH